MAPVKTISSDGILLRRLGILLLALIVAGCDVLASAPPCPFTGEGDDALSAGCFAIEDGALLVVKNHKGKLSPPGGMSLPGEAAQCTAYRETWEETGLRVETRELLQVFDTGFHLYRCERATDSGDIDPPARFEVEDAFFLPAEEFHQHEWRFRGQQQDMTEIFSRLKQPEP